MNLAQILYSEFCQFVSHFLSAYCSRSTEAERVVKDWNARIIIVIIIFLTICTYNPEED